ncbi:hypothetical protein JX265_001654 [Neoarthrinium moseri]|uniref:Clr5 domain-containing protein n=1 Tax=Neoarthrinium moseri TaxID=1658444 RepID=A0A9P9WVU1_9PEZI|nr:hypothetical protein JX266_010794 [Neoarthrinium moseri]KAI1880033.1 hypothetical protein JX265_001654 [Neoarthrinium moseri]
MAERGKHAKSEVALRIRQRASVEDWDQMRSIITQLYRDDDRKLTEVMSIMSKEHGFHATTRMYKRRLHAWGLDKKLKEDDVLQMLRISTSKTHTTGRYDGSVIFYVRGQRIESSRLRRYIHRTPKVLQRLSAGDVPAEDSIKAVTFQLQSQTSGRPLLAQNDRLRDTEQLLSSLRLYVTASLESGSWRCNAVGCWSTASTPEEEIQLHDTLHLPFVNVMFCLMQGATPDATGRELTKFFDALPSVVRKNPPFFICAILGMLLRLGQYKQFQLSKMLIGHIADLSSIYLGDSHELSRVARLIHCLGLEMEDSRHWYEKSLLLLVLSFEGRAGANNAMGVFVSVAYLASGIMNGGVSRDWLDLVGKYTASITQAPVVPSTILDGTKNDCDVIDLDPASQGLVSSTARGRLLSMLFDLSGSLELEPEDADKPELEWRLAAVNVAKKHFKSNLSESMLSPEHYATFLDFCAVLPGFQGNRPNWLEIDTRNEAGSPLYNGSMAAAVGTPPTLRIIQNRILVSSY